MNKGKLTGNKHNILRGYHLMFFISIFFIFVYFLFILPLPLFYHKIEETLLDKFTENKINQISNFNLRSNDKTHNFLSSTTTSNNKYNELKKFRNIISQQPLSLMNSEERSLDESKINSKEIMEVKNETVMSIKSLEHLPIFPEALTFENFVSNDISTTTKPKSVLVVGGTDGSGTRRVVQVLTDLGVTMVSEDPETYDIHADIVGGWPPIVTPVISFTKSLFYDPTKLPDRIEKFMTSSLTSLLDLAEKDSLKAQSFVLAVGGALVKPKGAVAESVSYGFKAPVAMTLSPWWAYLLPNFKLLHVLRDGRDISFSANQGPVDKFYRDMYGENGMQNQMPIKSMRLWSDWNSQIYNWAKQYNPENNKSKRSDSSFGYFALHSEDLVSQSISVKFAAISQLAEFVGSNLSDQEICCVALKGSEFMGSHDRTPKQGSNSESQVVSRYGKWKGLLSRDKLLSDTIHSVGSEGLKIFGYEPLRRLASEDMRSKSGYQCTADKCPRALKQSNDNNNNRDPKKQIGNIVDWTIQGVCNLTENLDFFGGDISSFQMFNQNPSDKTECCRACKAKPGCKSFTIDVGNSICYLKSADTVSILKFNLISGTLV